MAHRTVLRLFFALGALWSFARGSRVVPCERVPGGCPDAEGAVAVAGGAEGGAAEAAAAAAAPVAEPSALAQVEAGEGEGAEGPRVGQVEDCHHFPCHPPRKHKHDEEQQRDDEPDDKVQHDALPAHERRIRRHRHRGLATAVLGTPLILAMLQGAHSFSPLRHPGLGAGLRTSVAGSGLGFPTVGDELGRKWNPLLYSREPEVQQDTEFEQDDFDADEPVRPAPSWSSWSSKLENIRPVGGGGSGNVFKATVKGTDIEVAIKVIEIETEEQYRNLEREITSMEQIGGGDLISFFDLAAAIKEEGEGEVRRRKPVAFILMEAADGNLWDVLVDDVGKITQSVKLTLMVEILRGLEKMASVGYLHRDIKPENIFVFGDCVSDEGCHVKLGDLGMTQDTHEEDDSHSLVGSHWYIAPEVWGGKTATEKSDLFSVGVLLYELFVGYPPEIFLEDRFERTNDLESHALREYMPHHFDITKDDHLKKLKTKDKALGEFIESLLRRNAWRRPTVKQALKKAKELAHSAGLEEEQLHQPEEVKLPNWWWYASPMG